MCDHLFLIGFGAANGGTDPIPSFHSTLDAPRRGDVEFNQSRDERRARPRFRRRDLQSAIAAARIGARSGDVTELGDDVFGSGQPARVRRDEGVDAGGVHVVPGADTGAELRQPTVAQGDAFT